MSASERRKGVHFENEICAILRDRLGDAAVRRNLSQSRGGTSSGGDIVLGCYSIECKRREAFVGHGWLAQAQRDAGERTAIVITRANGRKPIAIIELDALLTLIQGEL